MLEVGERLARVAAVGAVALLVAVGAVACGDDGDSSGGGGDSPAAASDGGGADERDGDRAEIAAVVKRFERAVANRDGRAMCKLLARQRMQGMNSRERRRSCQAFVTTTASSPQRPTQLSVEAVRFDGGQARATAKYPRGSLDFTFVKEGGSWKIDLLSPSGA